MSAERNIFDNFVYVFKNFADFSGRASRAEYWYFTLASIIMQLVLGIISAELYFIYCVIAIIPGIAVSVRRLHDVGKSGWWLLICLTIIGAFYIIYLDCLPGEKTNRYGPNPYDAT
ncbi:MAG: DUF805 domain-containing protein [Acidaminococcales bacterium]|nr:DUF805 domain-containing protein [Acidaminococcales bacterium]